MNKIAIKKAFFKKLGIKSKYFLKEIKCDICGDFKKKDFLKKISLWMCFSYKSIRCNILY